jgi:hypothetical protein
MWFFSKKFGILFVLLSICLFSQPAQAKYGGGTGESNDPYLIYTAEQMNAIGADPNDLDKHFKLMADIDLSSYTGCQFNIIGNNQTRFTGSFDGNGHEIYNSTYQSTGKDYIGIFGYACCDFIKDVGLIDPNIDAGTGHHFGSLVGYFTYGSISGCYVRGGKVSGEVCEGGLIGGTVPAGIMGNPPKTLRISDCYAVTRVSGTDFVGGLIGFYHGLPNPLYQDHYGISDCYAICDISGTDRVGGLAGYNIGKISNCYSRCNVLGISGATEKTTALGGLLGIHSGQISNCYSICNVIGFRSPTAIATATGGLVRAVGGIFFSQISNCYSMGSVIEKGEAPGGTTGVGGLVGDNYNGQISNCYSRCSVFKLDGATKGYTSVGGLLGYNYYGQISNYYSSGSVEGNDTTGGLIGRNQKGTIADSLWDIDTSGQTTSDGGIGKTTAEMKQKSTFTNWAFTEVWDIAENQTYPFLRRCPAGDINGDCKVDFTDLVIMASHWLD